jgi:hypothetical protein
MNISTDTLIGIYLLIGVIYALINIFVRKISEDGDWILTWVWVALWPIALIGLLALGIIDLYHYAKRLFTILILLGLFGLASCVNASDRLADAQKKYPKCIVQPTTSFLARDGYEVMVEDTLTKQIYVISYYPFSSTKIFAIRNIK